PVKNKLLRAIAILVSVVVGAALVFSAYGGKMDPATSSSGAIAAMLFPIILMVSILLLMVNLLWFRISAVVTALSLIISWSAIITYCPIHLFRPSVESIRQNHNPYIKVMTYNMLNLDDFSRDSCIVGEGNHTLEYVLEENPHLLVFQEGEQILTPDVKNISPDQHKRLLTQYPYRHVNNRGMGILSHFPFTVVRVEHENRWLYDVDRYDVNIGSQTLTVFNLHLQSLGLTPTDKAIYHHLTNGETEDLNVIRSSLIHKLTSAFRERAKQAMVVRDAVDSISGSLLVCGDFNDIPGCYAQRVIQGNDLSDAYRQAGLGPAITYHADRFFFRIDHILYRGNLKPLRVFNGTLRSSDHFPIIAYFEITEN
ncbi:MAG: endonuclease/exonuclease/phosphatase family protein, partial [Bacteroides sp.]|nr:endonuclease/exonuclease/phosphatase family protein [Bacteroides sp.]